MSSPATTKGIAVINPNSNPAYTELIAQSLEDIRATHDVRIECHTLESAPFAIESDDDVQAAIGPTCAFVRKLAPDVSRVAIACFADPGLVEAREVSTRTVVGYCEAAMIEAASHGLNIGLISTGDDVEADCRLMKKYLPSIRSIHVERLGIAIPEIPGHPDAPQGMLGCGIALQEKDVDVIVLGCAGMAAYVGLLRDALRIPVIEPGEAAIRLLLNKVECIDAGDQSTAAA